MDPTISARDASRRFSDLLRRVRASSSPRGHIVARIMPVDERDRHGSAIDALPEFAATLPRRSAPGWRRADLSA